MKLPFPLPVRPSAPVLLALVLSASSFVSARVFTLSLPAALSDRDFWQLSGTLSEPGGTFRSENLVSNEMVFDRVLPALVNRAKGEGVYLGVGPEQNFTYIAAMRPRLAIILDIRRGNLHLHLLYKALFELSADRADFLARLFNRARLIGVAPDASARALFDALLRSPLQGETRFRENLAAVQERLVRVHGFELSTADLLGIEFVYSSFRRFGPSMTYHSSDNGTAGGRTTYADLMRQTDAAGHELSYLATPERFQFVQAMQTRNLIVPVVGDFAGPKALRAIGQYLRASSAVVSAFYVSNVESYLRQEAKWMTFCSNVTALPIDDDSIFLRPLGVATWSPAAEHDPPVLSGPIGHIASEVKRCATPVGQSR